MCLSCLYGQRLVLFSGSHGERCLPLAVMLLILLLRRAAPKLYALYELPKGARAKDGSRFLLVSLWPSALFGIKSFLAAFIQPRGCAGGRFVDF